MLVRPKILEFFSIFLIAVAVSFPIQIMMIYGHGPMELPQVFAKLTVLNWIVMFAALTNAALVYRAAPALKYTVPLMIVFVAINNWIIGKWHVDYSQTQAMTASGFFILAHGPLFKKSIFGLINHPEKRWWLRPMRKKTQVSAYVSPFNGLAFKAKTFDLSETGAFIPMSSDSLPAHVDDRVNLCLTLGLAQIRCSARIVRSTSAKGNYPAGIALNFDKLPWTEKRELRRYIESTI